MFKLDLEKAEESGIKLPISTGSSKKQESSRKPSTSALLTVPQPMTVWIRTNGGKFFKKMGIPDHLTCLLRNLYAGQEATVETRHETADWFQIGKGQFLFQPQRKAMPKSAQITAQLNSSHMPAK